MANTFPKEIKQNGLTYILKPDNLPFNKIIEWFLGFIGDEDIVWRGLDCVYIGEKYRISIVDGYIDFGLIDGYSITHSDESYLIANILYEKYYEFLDENNS